MIAFSDFLSGCRSPELMCLMRSTMVLACDIVSRDRSDRANSCLHVLGTQTTQSPSYHVLRTAIPQIPIFPHLPKKFMIDGRARCLMTLRSIFPGKSHPLYPRGAVGAVVGEAKFHPLSESFEKTSIPRNWGSVVNGPEGWFCGDVE
jgi:hypothetical protein